MIFIIELGEKKKKSPGAKRKQSQLSFASNTGTSKQSNVQNIGMYPTNFVWANIVYETLKLF